MAGFDPRQEVIAYCRRRYCVLSPPKLVALPPKNKFGAWLLEDGRPVWKADASEEETAGFAGWMHATAYTTKTGMRNASAQAFRGKCVTGAHQPEGGQRRGHKAAVSWRRHIAHIFASPWKKSDLVR
jgi:hypothetical protein